ncbi:uncharacterized protein LOC142338330 isoform X4 [Convolutriloba macropyga]
MVLSRDYILDKMLIEENEDHFTEMFALSKKIDQISKKASACHEGVAELARVLSENQTGLIVERLKKQIAESFLDFQRKSQLKQQEIQGLSLENSFQVEVSLLAKMNTESKHIREQILTSCMWCGCKVVERVDSYCKLLKYIWEREASEVVAKQGWLSLNDHTDRVKRMLIQDSLTEMDRTSKKFERDADRILERYNELKDSNEALAKDLFLVLNKLKQVQDLYDSTSEHYKACQETQHMEAVNHNFTVIQQLQLELKEWNRKVEFRERQKADPTTLQDLNRSIAQEKVTQARLNLRVKQLREAMSYTMESFKHSNKVHSDYLKEVNEKTIPQLFETTKQQAKELMNADLLGVKPLRKQLGKQAQCLVSKRTEGIVMTAEQMKLLEENTSINANLNFLDNAIARTESDLKSCKVDSQNTMHTLTTGKDEIEELEWIKLEGGRVLARLTGLTKSLQLTIPNIDRHRMAMIRKRQEYSSNLSDMRVTLRKISDTVSGDTIWQLIRELCTKWARHPEVFPELDMAYQKKLAAVQRLETSAARVLKQASLHNQRKTAELRKTV